MLVVLVVSRCVVCRDGCVSDCDYQMLDDQRHL
jgi:hypothetical protein